MAVIAPQKIELVEVGQRAVREVYGSPEGSRREIDLIQAGWGSSGYYSEDVLRRDGSKAFPVGTHMYLDHPTVTEERERPERSVRDLVATIATVPRMSGIKLVAEASILPHWTSTINALTEDIGLSIRAFGTEEAGDAGGKHGPIITSLIEGISVDFVTEAGAGGAIGKLIEESRRNTSIEEVLSTEIETSLRTAGTARWGEEHTYIQDWDIDENWAVFHVGLDIPYKKVSFERDSNGNVTLVGEGTPVERQISYVQTSEVKPKPDELNEITRLLEAGVQKAEKILESNRSGGLTLKEKEKSMSDSTELSELQDSFRQFKADTEKRLKESEAQTKEASARGDRAEDALRLVEAGKVIDGVVSVVEGLPFRAKQRAIESALTKEIPIDSDNRIDRGILEERAHAAVRAEQDYIKEFSGGSSKPLGVTGMGESRSAPSTQEDGKSDLEQVFGRMGLSENAAQTAAVGR